MSCYKIVHTFNVAAPICHSSALHWSETNKIALSTDKGIFILTSLCCPTEPGYPLPLHKQLIPPENILNFNLNIDKEEFNRDIDRGRVFALNLDHTLNPKTCNSPSYLGYRYARWSPPGILPNNGCILATLAMDHRLCLYKEENQWQKTEDLSLKLFGMMEKEILLMSVEKDIMSKYQSMKDLLYELAAVEITWTHAFSLQSQMKWCFLVAGMKSGHLVWWKVTTENDICVFVHSWKSTLGIISSLNWQQVTPLSGFLVIGSLEGQIMLLPMCVKVQDQDGYSVIFDKHQLIWQDKDRISVSKIAGVKKSDGTFTVLASKESHLISCDVIVQGETFVIKNTKYTPGIHSLSVTDICAFGSNQSVLLTSLDGNIVKLQISLKDTEIKQEEINLEIDTSVMVSQGISISPNETFCAMILQTSLMYDHLIRREPTQFIIFTIKPFEDAAKQLMKTMSSTKEILGIKRDIRNYSDSLDYFRISLFLNIPLPVDTKMFLCRSKTEIDHLTVLQLHFLRFLVKTMITTMSPTDIETEELNSILEEIISHIMKRHVLEVITQNYPNKTLSITQKTSLLLMCDWLFSCHRFLMNNIYTDFGQPIPTPDSFPTREKCVICNEGITLQKLDYGVCINSHKFGRCCQSLLLCDGFRYATCTGCKSLAMPQVWAMESSCTCCGSALSSLC